MCPTGCGTSRSGLFVMLIGIFFTKYIVRTFWTRNWIPDIYTTFRSSESQVKILGPVITKPFTEAFRLVFYSFFCTTSSSSSYNLIQICWQIRLFATLSLSCHFILTGNLESSHSFIMILIFFGLNI